MVTENTRLIKQEVIKRIDALTKKIDTEIPKTANSIAKHCAWEGGNCKCSGYVAIMADFPTYKPKTF